MADTQQKTDGQDEKASQQSSSQLTQSARSQQQGISRRSSDPLMVFPREFFSTSPFALMRRMSEEMDRIFGDSGFGRNQGDIRMWSPAIEVAERDGKYIVHAELPGLKPDEVTVEVTNEAIVIQGERQSQTQNEQAGTYRTERRYGRFYRAIPLPEGVNAATAPLPQKQSNRRQIPIQSGASNPPSGKTSAGSTTNPATGEKSGSSGSSGAGGSSVSKH